MFTQIFRNRVLKNRALNFSLSLALILVTTIVPQLNANSSLLALIKASSVNVNAQLSNGDKDRCLGNGNFSELRFGPGQQCEYTEYNSGKQCCNYYDDQYPGNGDRRTNSSPFDENGNNIFPITDPIVSCTRIKITPCDISNAVYLSPLTIFLQIPVGATNNITKNIGSSDLLANQDGLNGATLLTTDINNGNNPLSGEQLEGNKFGSAIVSGGGFLYTLTPDKFTAFKDANGGDRLRFSVAKPESGRCDRIETSTTATIAYQNLKANDDSSTGEDTDNPLPEITNPDGTKEKPKAIYIMKNDGTANNAYRNNTKLDVLQNDVPQESGLVVDSISEVVFPASSRGQVAPTISDGGKKVTITAPFGFTGAGQNVQREIKFKYKAKLDGQVSNEASVDLRLQCYKTPLPTDPGGSDETAIPVASLADNSAISDYGLGVKVRFPASPNGQTIITYKGKNYKVPVSLSNKVFRETGKKRGQDVCPVLGKTNNSAVSGATQKAQGVERIIGKLGVEDPELARVIKGIGGGQSTCYAAVWAALQKVNGNPKSPWGKIFNEVKQATEGLSNDARQFVPAMQRPVISGKVRNLVSEGITDPYDSRVPCGSIIVLDWGGGLSNDINVKTTTTGVCGQGSTAFWNYADMRGLMTTYKPGDIKGIYIPVNN